MIEENLRRLGLTDGEIRVYLALLNTGSTTTGKIVKRADVSASKVYVILGRLMKKGLVSYVITDGVRHYDANQPERLLDYVEDRKKDLVALKSTLKQEMPELKSRRDKAEVRNRVRVYTGSQGVRITLREAIFQGKQGGELLAYGTDEDLILKLFPEILEQHYKKQRKHNLEWKLIFNRSVRDKNIFIKKFGHTNKLTKVRYLPKGFVLPVRIFIMGEVVAIMDFSEPLTTIMIHKKQIADSYAKHFYYLWEIARQKPYGRVKEDRTDGRRN